MILWNCMVMYKLYTGNKFINDCHHPPDLLKNPHKVMDLGSTVQYYYGIVQSS